MEQFLASIGEYDAAFKRRSSNTQDVVVSNGAGSRSSHRNTSDPDESRWSDSWWQDWADDGQRSSDTWIASEAKSWSTGRWDADAAGSSTASNTNICVPPPPPPSTQRPVEALPQQPATQQATSSRAEKGWRPRGGKYREWHTALHALKKAGCTDAAANKGASAAYIAE